MVRFILLFAVIRQVVILIGSGPSALDISIDIVQVAKEVHVASRSAKVEVFRELFVCHNIQLHPMVIKITHFRYMAMWKISQ